MTTYDRTRTVEARAGARHLRLRRRTIMLTGFRGV